MKYFELKLYDNAGVFKKQINPRNIISQITFPENINWGQGNLDITIRDIASDYSVTDIIEVREVEKWSNITVYTWQDAQNWDDSDIWKETDSNVFPTYTGIVERISVQEKRSWEVITVKCLWIATVLNDILYKDGTSLSFNKNTTADVIIADIIDYFNSQYWTLSDTQNIWNNLFYYDDLPTAPNIDRNFENINCFNAISSICEEIGYYFFIEPTWEIHFQEIWENKLLTFNREIIEINYEEKKDEMVNRYFLEREWGNQETYENASSISTYKPKEKYESIWDINNLATQDIVWEKKVEEFWEPRANTSVLIKAQKTSFLYPWMTITTQNTRRVIQEQKITKIQKNLDFWTLYIWDFTSFGKTILKK